MRPHLEAHAIVFEFLDIVRRSPALPALLRPLQWMMIRAGIQVLPAWVIERLTLDAPLWQLRPWEARVLRSLGAVFERVALRDSPSVHACRRLGLPENFLYRAR
jgi:uncharacterized protein (DUF2236 family)